MDFLLCFILKIKPLISAVKLYKRTRGTCPYIFRHVYQEGEITQDVLNDDEMEGREKESDH